MVWPRWQASGSSRVVRGMLDAMRVLFGWQACSGYLALPSSLLSTVPSQRMTDGNDRLSRPSTKEWSARCSQRTRKGNTERAEESVGPDDRQTEEKKQQQHTNRKPTFTTPRAASHRPRPSQPRQPPIRIALIPRAVQSRPGSDPAQSPRRWSNFIPMLPINDRRSNGKASKVAAAGAEPYGWC